MFKKTKELEIKVNELTKTIQHILSVLQDLTKVEVKEEETKEEKAERERKERIDNAYQELFNYNETIAIKGDK